MVNHVQSLRSGFNDLARDYGNRAYNGLGDILTTEINLRHFVYPGLVGLGLVGLVACGRGVENEKYTVVEHLGNRVVTLGVGYRYDFFQGDEKGKLLYTVEPNYSGKFKRLMLADSFFLKDESGEVVDCVDGKIVTVSSTHNVYNPSGDKELVISRKLGGDLLDRIGRLITNRDGYFVKDPKGKVLLEIEETTASILSPLKREYKIVAPGSKKEIGVIRNKFKAGALLGAQTYEIELSKEREGDVRRLALVIRIIDGVEDLEEEKSSRSDD